MVMIYYVQEIVYKQPKKLQVALLESFLFALLGEQPEKLIS